ncbi:MAG: tetratricopeptide repeat protein [Pseudomonadota bacterium]
MMDLAPPPADLVKDATDQSFMVDVIEASREAAIVVEFWAPWCGPCKQLTPVLEAAVKEMRGQVKLVKVNIDENQMVAGQLRVQSIPAVFGFVGGQPVDAFMGAVTPGEAKAFVERLAKMAGEDPLEAALDEAEKMLDQGALADAVQTFAAILAEVPATARAHAGLVRAELIQGDIEKAKAVLAAVPAELAEDPTIQAVRSAVELTEAAAGAGEVGQLRSALEANPDDHQARFDLATALMGSGDNQGAVDELLELFRRDREWNESAAKEQLFKLFDSLGAKDPVALAGRRRLSSMIFS